MRYKVSETMEACYLTLRRLSTDMEEAGFCGRGTMGVVASLGRGGGGGGGGGWYQEGWRRGETNQITSSAFIPEKTSRLCISRVSVALWDFTSINLNVLRVSKGNSTYPLWPLDDGFS